MDPTPDNVIPFSSRRKPPLRRAAPPTEPPAFAVPPVDLTLSLPDLGLTRFGSDVLVTGPGCLLADENLRLAPAFTPADARLVATKMLHAAQVAECVECAPRLRAADEAEIYSADAVGLCARCAS